MTRASVRVPHLPGAFNVAIIVGVLAGAYVVTALDGALRTAAAMAIAILASITFALATKVIAGEEHFTWYHYQLLSLATAAVVLRSLQALDAFAAGLAVTHAIGRVGCLFAGCCHGRPWRAGIRYDNAHIGSGFAPHFAGITLLPTQAIESICELSIGAWCALSVLRGAPAGTSLVRYLIGYAVLRFTIELLRGDARRSLFGVSEAQWTATLVTIAVSVATRNPICIAIASALIVAVIAIAFAKRDVGEIDAIARALFALRMQHDNSVASAGRWRLSCGLADDCVHYTLSSSAALGTRNARRVARILEHLGAHRSAPHLIAARPGIFHVVFRSTS